MSTSTPVQFGYRCTTCYQLLLAGEDETGTQAACPYCGQQVTVPEVTPERIALAQQSEHFAAAAPEPGMDSWTDTDIERELKRQIYLPPNEMQNLESVTSPAEKRLFGWVVDNGLMVVAIVAGILLAVGLDSIGLLNLKGIAHASATGFTLEVVNVVLVIYFLAAALCIFQWWLISTRGQSIGKLLLGMRIVTADGRNPGFLQAVVLRNWVRVLLSMLPFFALVDAMFIFSESRRCVHDYIAGTYVVDV